MTRSRSDFGPPGFPKLPKVPAVFMAAVFCICILGLAVLVWAVKSWVNVSSGEIAIFVKKTGELPESGDVIIAKDATFKGIQHDVLPEGWHFKNYFSWQRIDSAAFNKKITIPPGKSGIKVRLYGDPLPPGEVLAKDPGQKGIVPGVMEPGTYPINRLAYDVILADAIEIKSGFKGVVLNKAGTIPDNTNVFVVKEGERGIQKKTLPPSTRYINPYEVEIISVDMRSQIYQLGQNTNKKAVERSPITFPSKDGFQITLEGKIEWKINPDRVSEVFVKYVDERPVITCVVEKIILPNTRSFVRIYGSMEEARNFIEGGTRQRFQEKLFADLKTQCNDQGIIILNVSITEMLPPPRIASLINDREVAKRTKAKYLKEKDREKQEKMLAMEKKLQDRSRLIKEIEARMAVKKTLAQQEKQVAIVEANKKLSVAKLELEASRKLANAILSRGQAKADIIGYNNIAVSAGIRKAAEAFKSGESYARYLFLQKVAPGFMYILANTDGPFIKIFNELFGKGVEK